MGTSGWVVVWWQLGGVALFTVGTIALGIGLRRKPEKTFAERTSRMSHLLYWLCLVVPGILGFFWPGLTHFDRLVGLHSLPYRAAATMIGIMLLAPGVYLSIVSNAALNRLGHGAAAFKLTKVVVQSAIYERTRNPMSLGYYLLVAGISLLAGSTYLTCVGLFWLIPAHVFNLKYFEEFELGIRHGQSYREYKQRVPFLIPRFSLNPKAASEQEQRTISSRFLK